MKCGAIVQFGRVGSRWVDRGTEGEFMLSNYGVRIHPNG